MLTDCIAPSKGESGKERASKLVCYERVVATLRNKQTNRRLFAVTLLADADCK